MSLFRIICLFSIFVFFSCKSHKSLGIINCPGGTAQGDSTYAEIYYKYRHIKEVNPDEIPLDEKTKLDSLYSFTVAISGHEGWSLNGGHRYNSYYHPEYFVVKNPNIFAGKPRNDHDFSLYCPNKLSEQIRLFINNDLEVAIDSIKITVKPYRYLYNKSTKNYFTLLQITEADTSYL